MLRVHHHDIPQGTQLRLVQRVVFAWLLCLAACTGSKGPDSQGADSSNAGKGAPYANSCVGIDCACADAGPDKSFCGGKCVTLQDDALNCGACGQACGRYQSCVQGVCTCPTGELWCDASCTQVADDRQNCGACGVRCKGSELCEAGACKPNTTSCKPACEDGQTCQDGKCACPTGQTFCDERCVDTLTNPAHCGGCGAACDSDTGCTNGSCTCGRGETACSESCVDLLSDVDNCGSCGRVCGAGQLCDQGTCRSAWTDGCTEVAAHELRLREIAAYQSIEIPIAAQGQAVAAKTRPVPLVQGRPTLFRVSVDLGSNFKAREFSARLSLWNNGNIARYSSRKQVSVTSSDGDPASTFLLNVPGDKIGADTTYALELVECSTGSGVVDQARFPASGEAELGARTTASLDVTLIPVLVSVPQGGGSTKDFVPDMSSAVLQQYRDYLEAMYPVDRVNLSVGKQISTDHPIDWTALVEQIRAQRKADSPASNVYYYGLVKPTDSLADYCNKGCTAGIGYVTPTSQAATRAAVGLAFGDEISASTMAHEIGHNHGRNHAPCSPGKISGVDADYPDKKGELDVWGYDARKQEFWPPGSTHDIMGYCDPKWTSAYTYKGLLDRVIAVNELDGIVLQETLPTAAYRVMVLNEEGEPRWGVPFDAPAEAYGVAESAEILDSSGQLIQQVTVYRTPLSVGAAATILIPPPESDWHAVQVVGAVPLPF